MRGRSSVLFLVLLIGAAARSGAAESKPFPLLVTQTPLVSSTEGGNWLDQRYPLSSRIVFVERALGAVRLATSGLVAAGDPVALPGGKQMLFVGKPARDAPWQIYLTDLRRGWPRVLTDLPGGAMSPALLPNGTFLFVSPVPESTEVSNWRVKPELYAQSLRDGTRQKLSYGTSPILDVTVLRDGRVLFVSTGSRDAQTALFTVNNDGTEVTAFAAHWEGRPIVRRPRDLLDGRISFLASDSISRLEARPEFVWAARPFATRTAWLPMQVTSLEPVGTNEFIFTARSGTGPIRVYGRMADGREAVVIHQDASWNELEAVPLRRPYEPMGHISTMDPKRKTGLILCLDVNRTSWPGRLENPAHRIRVTTRTPSGAWESLGETDVEADGSFLVEVPADVPLGMQALNSAGQPVAELPPYIWVRPGENRACVGCHERHNTAPRNARPLAVKKPPVQLFGRSELAIGGAP